MPRHAEIPPGPNAGRVWRDPPENRRDPITGRTVTRLTGYRGHSHHLAGPMPCWLDDGKILIVVSDREGHGNLFAHHFSTGALTQLTDLRGGHRPGFAQLSIREDKLSFCYGDLVYELELISLKMRMLPPSHPVGTSPQRKTRQKPTLSLGRISTGAKGDLVWLADGTAVSARRALVLIEAAEGESRYAATLPCLDPSGQRVVFGADTLGYAQIYAVEIGRFEQLPRLSALTTHAR